MSIDWFTFVAQIINFLILVGLLRWLLYRPIVDAMAQRQEELSRRWNDAEQKQTEASEMIAQYESKHAEFDRQREEMMHDVRRETLEHRERLMREARDDVELKRTEWLGSLEREQAESADEIRERLAELAIHSTRHTLQQLANAELDEQVAARFVDELSTMDETRREELRALLQDQDSEVHIRSAFELSDETRDRIRDVVRSLLEFHGEIQFERSPELICGVQLDTGGYSVEWNVDDFVRQISTGFGVRSGRQH